ncbi:MAG: ATP-binding protein [Anaerolineae bacterium]|nr:ATP-binding protein [Anaerolineae bacterium]
MTDRPLPRISNPQIRTVGGARPLAETGAGVAWTPPPINSLADTGLNLLGLADLVVKVLYNGGYLAGHQIADIVKLPYTGVIDTVMDFLKREKYVEVRGSGGLGEAGYQYLISQKGSEKAREAIERSNYAGAAPVTLQQYIQAMNAQNREKLIVHEDDMKTLMQHLVVSDDQLARIGPAINSGRSVFMYGPPGNGKTTVAETVGRLVLGDDMWIPYSIDVDGQVVRVYDSVNHELAEEEKVRLGTGVIADPRWIHIKRPMIMTGGELTLSGLDLVYDNINKYYEAPVQVKANGGMFLIDDFGRQQVRPRDLLNRWIVPLEKGVDFLTLATGRKIEVPFYVLIVFSTNIDPRDLVDEAFLRRIRHKIEFTDPTYDQFREIFRRVCASKGIAYDEQALAYLLKKWYIEQNRALRSVHPRDLIAQLIDIATYLNKPPALTKDMLDRSAASYFVNL